MNPTFPAGWCVTSRPHAVGFSGCLATLRHCARAATMPKTACSARNLEKNEWHPMCVPSLRWAGGKGCATKSN
eukprot:1396718-Pyramimonas_sp.AAC.1